MYGSRLKKTSICPWVASRAGGAASNLIRLLLEFRPEVENQILQHPRPLPVPNGAKLASRVDDLEEDVSTLPQPPGLSRPISGDP